MRTLLTGFDLIATMDETRCEIADGYVLVEDNRIVEIGDGSPTAHCDEVIDGNGKVLLPGFVNTHHHLYQTLFRNVPGAANMKLFDWLTFLYERWQKIGEDAVRTSAAIGCAELLCSGATTTVDHLYLVPNDLDGVFDAEIEGARLTGIRFHPCRGSMSLSRQDGGLPLSSVVQGEKDIVRDCVRVIERYHDPEQFSMLQFALAPCSPFSVTEKLMRSTIELADEYDVLLHTHLAETEDEEEFCKAKFGIRPVDYMEQLGWLRDDVWFAHLVHINEEDIKKLSDANAGMSYCPSSNMILGSGVAPVVELVESDVKVSVGVDGSGSNDTSNMIREVRQAMLVQRLRYGAENFSARDALFAATMGGASVLHREDEIGSIEVGKAADLIAFDISGLEFAGSHSDPLAAVVHCGAQSVDFAMVNGEVQVRDRRLTNESIYDLVAHHNDLSARLIKQT